MSLVLASAFRDKQTGYSRRARPSFGLDEVVLRHRPCALRTRAALSSPVVLEPHPTDRSTCRPLPTRVISYRSPNVRHIPHHHDIKSTHLTIPSPHISRTQPSKSIQALPATQTLNINALITNMPGSGHLCLRWTSCRHERIHVASLYRHRHTSLRHRHLLLLLLRRNGVFMQRL